MYESTFPPPQLPTVYKSSRGGRKEKAVKKISKQDQEELVEEKDKYNIKMSRFIFTIFS